MNPEESHIKNNRIFALSVLLFTFLVFWLTVAPSVSFWDCGEYIGASHSLGIPHPPGNPSYVLIGKLFSILFGFISQVAFRINIISVLSGAIVAMLVYLIIIRTTIGWLGIPDNSWKRITVYTGGVVGAFFAVFNYTFWFSAVEASVYVPSMVIVCLGTWLALVWEQSKSPNRDRILILISYIVFFGIGIHMMAMLAMIPVFLFVIMSDRRKLQDVRIWFVGIALASSIYQVSWFLWLCPSVTVLALIMSLFPGNGQKTWKFCFWLSFAAMLGYSVHIYIPIRAALEPIINENDPVTWDAFKQFLERKQYGSDNFIVRMFHRRGDLFTKQFGIDDHMGYGGFHLTQFFHFGSDISLDRTFPLFKTYGGMGGLSRLILYLTPTFLMFFGWWYLFKKAKNKAIMLVGLVLLGSAGLVFYMNFADGNHAEMRDFNAWKAAGSQGPMPTVHREVRIRDYFFTSGFVFYGMWIGLAFSCLLHYLYTNKDRVLRTTIAPIMVVLIAASPVLPLTQNFSQNNRKGDWIPFDYAYNLLMSCEKDGILFTNGDNDTFPLWFLQEAEGIRRDVRIVNLSLLNTKWYIKQLKKLEPIVHITYSEEQIDNLNHELNPFEKDVVYKMRDAGISVQIPGRDKKRALRVQDKMVLHIADVNKWRKPVYFAVTVSGDNRMGLDPYMKMEGLVYRLHQQPQTERIDLDRSLYLLDRVYRYRGLGDGTALMSETSHKLLANYAAGFMQVGIETRDDLINLKKELDELGNKLSGENVVGLNDSLKIYRDALIQTQKDYEKSLNMVLTQIDRCVGLMPWDWRPRYLRHEILMEHDRFEQAEQRAREALIVESDKPEYLRFLSQALIKQGKTEEANEVLKDMLKSGEGNWETYFNVARQYESLQLYDSAITLIQQYQTTHPGDHRSRIYLERLQESKLAQELPVVPAVPDSESTTPIEEDTAA